jgi:hypothetical protein
MLHTEPGEITRLTDQLNNGRETKWKFRITQPNIIQNTASTFWV